jgi:hypothetical protein
MVFTDKETAKLEDAAAADERIRRGDHFNDWLALGVGLMTLRIAAMRAVGTNEPQGPPYRRKLTELEAPFPWTNRDKATRAHAVWLAENIARVNAWRDTLASNKREALNHPSAVKRAYEAAHRAPTEAKPDGKQSPTDRIKEMEGKIADLEERNAHLEGKVDGGTFDFERDSFESIKAVIDRLPHKASLKRKVEKIIAALQAWHGIAAKR